MIGFFYSIFLKLLYPTSVSLLLLLLAAVFRGRKSLSRTCFWMAIVVLMVCGNGWITGRLVRHLEWQNMPPSPVPEADCIIVLSGGLLSRTPPRPTIEVADAGDRVIYGAYLFREQKAPYIICTGNVATGGIARRPASEDMADFLEMLGVEKSAIITEIRSENTHEHAINLYPLLKERGFKHVLLVTSAMHMPRALGVFKRLCPGIEITPAPTDFHVTKGSGRPWYYKLGMVIPTPRNLVEFTEVMHEYLGIAYYRIRGWI